MATIGLLQSISVIFLVSFLLIIISARITEDTCSSQEFYFTGQEFFTSTSWVGYGSGVRVSDRNSSPRGSVTVQEYGLVPVIGVLCALGHIVICAISGTYCDTGLQHPEQSN